MAKNPNPTPPNRWTHWISMLVLYGFAAASLSLLIQAKGDEVEKTSGAIVAVYLALNYLKLVGRQAVIAALISATIYVVCYAYVAAHNGHI